MIKILKYFSILSIAFLLTNCDGNDRNTTTYLGGKIINPKTDFVLLFNQNKLIDTLSLDAQNKFLGEYENFKEGFYYFIHGNENQSIYIQPQDSILIRLNTWDFDESLVFSGKGADKNNILIDCFLESEKEENNYTLYKFYSLRPDLFKQKMDSVLLLRQKKIDIFRAKNKELPKSYLNILEIASKYPIYNRFERYHGIHKKRIGSTSIFPKIDNSFYSYRKNININIDSLMYIENYRNYVLNRLYNDVYSKGTYNQGKGFTVSLLKTIGEKINNEDTRNSFLRRVTISDFFNNSSCNIDKEVFYTYYRLSTDIDDKKHVQRLLNDLKTIHYSDKIAGFEITDYLKVKRNIKKIIKNKNSVIYFWSPKYTSNAYLVKRINYLTKRFPKINFILVKINDIDSDHVNGIDIKNQFYIDSSSKANLFLTSKYPRTLLVNKKGIVVNGYANIRTRLFNKQVDKLEKN